jgi:Gluconate 2-dehydrogenase subunit 3
MSSTGSDRRDFLIRGAVAGACLLTFTLSGCETKLTPAQARSAKVPLRALESADVGTLEALGETLLPGSTAAGLAHYIDHQLSGPPADSMLMIKYLRVAAPFDDFYRGGLRATEAAAQSLHGKRFAELDARQATALVTQMSGGHLEGWQGPPAALFYFVLRNDAVDVVYGTQAGFERLGVPYMPHIAPPSRWGE